MTADPYPTWQKLEELVQKGKIKNIGISKYVVLHTLVFPRLSLYLSQLQYPKVSRTLVCFLIDNLYGLGRTDRIKNLTANPLKIQPAVNQVELNFWNPQPELVNVSILHLRPQFQLKLQNVSQWSKENGLLLEAYSPLGSSDQVKETLSQPEVRAIAKELDITLAQVIISWHVQRGVRPLYYIYPIAIINTDRGCRRLYYPRASRLPVSKRTSMVRFHSNLSQQVESLVLLARSVQAPQRRL